MNKIWETIKDIIGQLCTILVLLIIVAYTVVSFMLPELPKLFNKEPLSQELNYAIIFAVLGVTMLIALPIIVWINSRRNRDKLTKELKETTDRLTKELKETTDKLTRELKETTDKLKITNELVEKIKASSVIKKSEIIENKDDFYSALESARRTVSENKGIRLMNFEQTIQEQEADDTGRYDRWEIEFCHEREDVQLFEIVSIHTRDKFKECLKLAIEAEWNKLDNFHLAYLHLENFEEGTPPRIIGVQIIDNTVILMNPISGQIGATAKRETLFMESKEIAEIYSEYYGEVWEEIRAHHKNWREGSVEERNGYIGYILYKVEEKRIAKDDVWRAINNYLPENERLSKEELAEYKESTRNSFARKVKLT